MRIIHLIDALIDKDAVSQQAFNFCQISQELGYESLIVYKYKTTTIKLNNKCLKISNYKVNSQDIILFHFSGKTELSNYLKLNNCKKILLFQNITPPYLLKSEPNNYWAAKQGYKLLGKIIPLFDYYVTPSLYSKKDLIHFGVDPTKCFHISLIVDINKNINLDWQLIDQYGLNNWINVMYLGRIARNKCIEEVIEFYTYLNQISDKRSNLFLIGNDNYDKVYSHQLIEATKKLKLENVKFTGLVNENLKWTYLYLSDIYCGFSVHEGFCVPLIESSLTDNLIVYKTNTAMKDTMNSTGIGFKDANYLLLAKKINNIINNKNKKCSILAKQRENASFYSKKNVKQSFKAFLKRI